MTDRFQAVIMDMDGVVTDSAKVHAFVWQRVFDEFLSSRGAGQGAFSDDDYRRYVDGRIRIDGVTCFLASRGIELPLGAADDASDAGTAWGLANRKNELFALAVEELGVRPFPTTIDLLGRLREARVPTALVTASRNADLILDAAGIPDLFDARVDGIDASELGLPGKPDPAVFIEAARRLGVHPGTCVIIEDAIAGVEAGRRGGFGLVVGVDRAGDGTAMRGAGADIVVDDLGGLPDERLFATDAWTLAYRGFDPRTEGTREALLTLGNGYMATRGAMTHASRDAVHYPGTYAAGVYNRIESRIGDHVREDESIVNLPNWLPLTFRIGDDPWLSTCTSTLADHRVALDLRRGTLTRTATVVDATGRRTRLTERRLVSMADAHLAAIELRLEPENWSGRLEIRTGIDGETRNANVAAYAELTNRHLDLIDRQHRGPVDLLAMRTSRSDIEIAVAARTVLRSETDGREQGGPLEETALEETTLGETALEGTDRVIGHRLSVVAASHQEVVVEKVVAIYTSHDNAIAEPAGAALQRASDAPEFDAIEAEHAERWGDLWRRFDIDIDDGVDAQLAVRVHLFHLLQTLSPHTGDLDTGVPARGLHGEAYRGHIFWDELFVFPVLDVRLPELARSLLFYRWRRLPTSRRRAAALGCRGALFAWQSGSDGREETETELYNPRSASWMPDNSRLQYHVNVAVAYNVWSYWQVTADLGFLASHGAELLVESARVFADLVVYDPTEDRYDLRGVMGPDEFHDGYPDRPGAGIDNNAYLNVMVSWALARAIDTLEILGGELGADLRSRLDLAPDEIARWDHVSRRLRIPFLSNGLLAQFEGYEALDELEWDQYRERYGNIGRLDLILAAEGDSTNRYRASKQADVLMLFYLFGAEELSALLTRLGYRFDPATIPATVDYYLVRTTHGSTLSRVVTAWVLARTDRIRSWDLFGETLDADMADTQGGTTKEGIHLGAMAGSIDILQRCYTGMELHSDTLWFAPLLPDELKSVTYVLRYRDQIIDVHIDHRELTVSIAPGPAPPITIGLLGDQRRMAAGERTRCELATRDQVPPHPAST